LLADIFQIRGTHSKKALDAQRGRWSIGPCAASALVEENQHLGPAAEALRRECVTAILAAVNGELVAAETDVAVG
jgi:hypothetical protein